MDDAAVIPCRDCRFWNDIGEDGCGQCTRLGPGLTRRIHGSGGCPHGEPPSSLDDFPDLDYIEFHSSSPITTARVIRRCKRYPNGAFAVKREDGTEWAIEERRVKRDG